MISGVILPLALFLSVAYGFRDTPLGPTLSINIPITVCTLLGIWLLFAVPVFGGRALGDASKTNRTLLSIFFLIWAVCGCAVFYYSGKYPILRPATFPAILGILYGYTLGFTGLSSRTLRGSLEPSRNTARNREASPYVERGDYH